MVRRFAARFVRKEIDMPSFAVDRKHARLTTAEGMPLFLLVDDVRAATERAALPDWEAYLSIRARQGFNAVLLDALRTPELLERMAELVAEASERDMYVLAWRDGAIAQAAGDAPRVMCGLPGEGFDDGSADLVLCNAIEVESAKGCGLPVVARPSADGRAALRAGLWRALLGGAFGGLTFSATGLSSWDDPNAGLADEAANDFAFAKQAVDYFDLTWGEPWGEIVVGDDEVACARTSSTALLYVPDSREVVLGGDFSEVFVQAIDLTSGEGSRLDFAFDGEVSRIPAHPFASDALYVIRL